jgi:hypothetical protein
MAEVARSLHLDMYDENSKFCKGCPKLGKCAVIQSINRLDDWCSQNAADDTTEDRTDDIGAWNPDQVEVFLLTPHVGRLLADLIDVQTECVASMYNGGPSLQDKAVTVVSHSVVRDLVQPQAA